jgi:CDP-glycerol glycerophosphotransferase (TagB/SpsB family)/glycosyltransferase involved in cell wall biosynthesis
MRAVARPTDALARLKRTRLARLVKHRVLRRPEVPPLPRVSVVVPVLDAAPYLPACLDALLQQTHPDVEVVVVDDGSTDGSLEIARSYARTHAAVRLVQQPHSGIGAARNRGVAEATGELLAFCDADDLPRPTAYERLAAALQTSGSDIAVGSVCLQRYGRFQEPDWARRAHQDRREGVRLGDVPGILANQITGARVFRRSFWDEHALAFPTGTRHPDAVLLARAMAAARCIDVLPAIAYDWRWREDMRSSLQRDLRDAAGVAGRVRSLTEAAGLLGEQAGQAVQQQFLVDVLHTTVPDLVRAAVTRDQEYWDALSRELRRLTETMTPDAVRRVPVEDRVAALLCARDERAAAEDFLEYSKENRYGYPYRRLHGHSYIRLRSTDEVVAVDDDLVRVSDSDLRYRTRLTVLRWTGPTTLRLEGAAYVEYVGDDAGASEVTLVLRDPVSGHEVTAQTTAPEETTVNHWSGRAHENHEGGAFAADVDVRRLHRQTGAGVARYDVHVRLRVAGLERTDRLQRRQFNGSAGLLEPSRVGGVEYLPRWRQFQGLAVVVGPAGAAEEETPEHQAPESWGVTVDAVTAHGAEAEIHARASRPVRELALVGSRSATPWVPAQTASGGLTARLPLRVDEWGFGEQGLPADNYRLAVRYEGGQEDEHAGGAPELRRRLPLRMVSGDLVVAPNTTVGGRLGLRVDPFVHPEAGSPYFKQRLRDNVYQPGRTKPVVPAVFFETFGGKAAGDNLAPLCDELVRRGTGLDLAFSVLDHSVAVPDGARPVIRWSAEWHELLARAEYVVVNANLPYFFHKRDGQTYLQTWHGSPLKRLSHDRPDPNFDHWHHRRQLSRSVRDWDYLVSQSPFCTESLRSAFRYDGTVLETGYPRNDVLLSPVAEEVRRRTRRRLGISDDQRVVLYAPTWRDNMRKGKVFEKVIYLDTHLVADRLDDTVVLVRGHYHTILGPRSDEAAGRVLDVTRYPDISHLYLAADALVTDYSSVFFDFSLTDKPMAFLAPDLPFYRDENRGFYFDYHRTVPGPVCDSTDDVIDALAATDTYADVRAAFRSRFAPYDDGKAASRVVDAVFGTRA